MRQTGFTLLEILLVTLILSMAAAAMVNGLSTDYSKLDNAAEDFATAIRFARAEAMRTNSSVGIEVNPTSNQLRVYNLVGTTPTYTVYHPIDKQLYTILLDGNTNTKGVDLVSAQFNFTGGFSSTSLLDFNSNGAPKITNSGKDAMLTSASLILSYKGQQRTLSVASMTGRVAIQ